AGRERVEQLVGRLRGADLRRMDAAADREDGFARGREPARLVWWKRTRIREPLIRRTNLIEVPDVLRGADDRRDRPMSLRRRSDVGDFHAVGFGGREIEVFFDRLGGGELAVGAHPESEKGLRRRHLSRCGGGRGERHAKDQKGGANGIAESAADRLGAHERLQQGEAAMITERSDAARSNAGWLSGESKDQTRRLPVSSFSVISSSLASSAANPHCSGSKKPHSSCTGVGLCGRGFLFV